jgi:DNA-binding NtrC family response regulator
MKRILIVEDDPALQKCIQFCLEKEGYEAEGTSCVRDATSRLQAHHYDLIITDYHLSVGETGLELLDLLKELDARIPAIMISASQERQLPAESLRHGGFAFLAKPFDLEMFIEICREAMT